MVVLDEGNASHLEVLIGGTAYMRFFIFLIQVW